MKILIAMPCMDMVRTETMVSLAEMQREGAELAVTKASITYDARNALCYKAVKENYDRLLFIDSDMSFQADLLQRLSADMDEHDLDYVGALCFRRAPGSEPTVYKKILWAPPEFKPKEIATVEVYRDYPREQLFECAGTGAAATMMSTDLIARIGAKDGWPFSPLLGLGEDLSFNWRAMRTGAKLWCDSRIKVGHVGTMMYDESTWDAWNKRRDTE